MKNVTNEPSFVYFGIDKITLGMESRCLNYTRSPYHLRHIIDIVNHGDWSSLHIQLETNGMSNINFLNPWFSVLYALEICIQNGFFAEPLARKLYDVIFGIYFGMLHPYSLISQFFDTGIFRLTEYELFFDFYGYNPFFSFSNEYYKKVQNSRYTLDYKEKKRATGESKGIRRSLLCFYKRGIKINSPFNINRLEFRICDDRAKAILNPMDIFYSIFLFIETHGDQIKSTLKRYMPKGSIKMDDDYIYHTVPILSKLIWLL